MYTDNIKLSVYVNMYRHIKLDNRIYSHTVNANLILICTKLSEI